MKASETLTSSSDSGGHRTERNEQDKSLTVEEASIPRRSFADREIQEDSRTKTALARWLSPNLLYLALFSVIAIVIIYYFRKDLANAIGLVEAVGVLIVYCLLTGLFVGLTLKSFATLMGKLRIWQDLGMIEEISRKAATGNPPSESLIFNLLDLRYYLIEYAASRKIYSFPGGFYESQLRRKIDLIFACINEALYRNYWKEKKEKVALKDPRETRGVQQFGYPVVGELARNLRTHLVSTRRWFRTSSNETSTLLYLFEDWQTYFKMTDIDMHDECRSAVERYNDKQEKAREEATARKRDLVLEVLRQGSVAILVLIIGYLLGMKAV